ncbi:hypothetical protein SEA_ARGAN_59 [Arthrobacter phage Argan]|nr:hypothetical protein SEA_GANTCHERGOBLIN_59 [Arthrobacter phage GantcherGoblin]UVK62880.1 hypothetical protein SEA_UZUMAKI_58 [Arthrobacter phage Uzumaki]WNT45443.1 hypothetical protein SEA_ARGAN_59 [Arthrobacter phage Argan]
MQINKDPKANGGYRGRIFFDDDESRVEIKDQTQFFPVLDENDVVTIDVFTVNTIVEDKS